MTADSESQGGAGGRLRALAANFELAFVVGILAITIVINLLIPQKLSFLNFYFLPIILAGYLLDQRKAMLGGLFCVLLVGVYGVFRPEAFYTPQQPTDLYLHITVWGAFLVLAGVAVGKLQGQLREQARVTQRVNETLVEKQQELVQTNASLEQSKRAVEALKAKVEETLYTTMDSSVAHLIIEGRLRNEKRDLSILFSDLVGFTAYSEERPPEVVISELNRYLRDSEPVILRYRGHIDKYMGDGIMCEFGAPVDFDTYALAAVLASLGLQERVARGNYPWQMRIGIASGSAITGLIGWKKQSYTAIGDVVNLAARLEKACDPGGILIDLSTYDRVTRFVETRRKRDLGSQRASDIATEQEIEAWQQRLTGTASDAEVHYQIGQLYVELNESEEALVCFERALRLDPSSTTFKVAYADATLRRGEAGKISVKGKRRRVEAYEVVRLKDPLEERAKIPQRFYDEHAAAARLIGIPLDVVLPVEALDGSVGHATVVAVIAFALAQPFDLTDREKLEILRAAFLADVGKEGVPHHLLNRRGSIMPGEAEILRQHPVESTRVMRAMGYDQEPLLKIVRHSHELYRGGGYPDGLAGEDIPLGSRIVAVADAYDAVTSWRPYRDAWERRAALEEIARSVERGLYDPRIVDRLVRLME